MEDEDEDLYLTDYKSMTYRFSPRLRLRLRGKQNLGGIARIQGNFVLNRAGRSLSWRMNVGGSEVSAIRLGRGAFSGVHSACHYCY